MHYPLLSTPTKRAVPRTRAASGHPDAEHRTGSGTGQILVLGLGNDLLSDEAVGIRVVRFLAEHSLLPPEVVLLDGGTLSFTLAGPLAAASGLILVDAARLGIAPGGVQLHEGAAMDLKLAGSRRSVHEVSLADLLDIARLTDTLPVRRCLVAIEPERIDWGLDLTPAVAQAVPQAAKEVLGVIARWQGIGSD